MSSNEIIRVAAPLRQQVVGMLRTAIADGRYAQGDRLVERELCELLQISRPILREALRQLEAEGLVRNVPQRGIEVVTLTSEDVRQIYQVRGALESLAAAEFVTYGTEAQWQSLDRAMQAFDAAAAEGVPSLIQAAKTCIFEILMAGCGNQVIAQTLISLHNRILLLRGISLREPGRIANTVKELHAVHDALLARDPARVEIAYRTHIDNSAQSTMAAIERTHRKPPQPNLRTGRARAILSASD
jgi:GntR family transcriptional regulator, trigonelline degradation regulator